MNDSNMTAQDRTDKKQEEQLEINQFRLLTFKQVFLKISLNLRTAILFETHTVEGQLNILKLRMLRVGTRRPNFRGERQH